MFKNWVRAPHWQLLKPERWNLFRGDQKWADKSL
jgi:hypothetical protein